MTGQDIFTNITTYDFSLSDELNSEIFYKYLNNLNILNECKAYCEPLLTLDNRVSVKNICARTLSYLKTKYSTPDNNKDEYDSCTLLNYWVYSRLDMAYGYRNDSKIFRAHGNLIQKWYDFIDHKLNKTNPNICKPIPNIPAQPDWKERKELLNYCVDVNFLRKTIYSYPNTCNKYYRYIESKTKLYKQYEQACSSGKENMCPDFFNSCEVYDPVKVLPTLPCHPEMEKTKDVALEIPIRDDRGDPESRSKYKFIVTNKLHMIVNILYYISINNIRICYTYFILFFIYKFTPLGRMLRNKFGWNNNNNISYNNLPSVKFENDIKELINYSTFEKFEENNTDSDEIDTWIKTFESNIEAYLTDSSEKLSINNEKRCKHFNYIINTIINKVNSISSNLEKRGEWSNKIKESRKKILLSNNDFNCEEYNKYIDENYKILGTYCEDSDFIKPVIQEIQNSVYCSNIDNNLSSRKNILINVRGNKGFRAGWILKIDNECSIQYLDTILPPITCNSSVTRSSQSNALYPSVNHVDGEEGSEELMTQQAPEHGGLTNYRQGLVTTSGENENEERTSSNTINLVAFPILGVLGCSFLLYKVSIMIKITNVIYFNISLTIVII
ncbi:hypothetical protein PVNG_05984 [Plasmodium vivax North Korean]|uniref:Variable surface protein n=1 Tax=Plasmodium vivax North Korean TaxID=1035514 RepID=A0A0J9TLQ2_PLAVI|nr:hypothetical protein PVNG_05984 [Plasmodium vivax North Korean]